MAMKQGEIEMSNIWITSDTHLGHDRDFIWKPRGFNSVDEMNNEIIKRWNEKVQPEDIVYHLGDVMLGDNEVGENLLKQLNGNIKFIIGNHDTNSRIKIYEKYGEILGYATVIKHKKKVLYLSHYPTLTGNFDDAARGGTLNLCGHVHTFDKFLDTDKGAIYHCEMDAHNCYPILLDDVITDIKNYCINERGNKE